MRILLHFEREEFKSVYMINAGYTGPNCRLDINECQSDPCENSGQCTEPLTDMYQCICQAGYTGINCEVDIAECASDPCQGHQVCEDLPNAYR